MSSFISPKTEYLREISLSSGHIDGDELASATVSAIEQLMYYYTPGLHPNQRESAFAAAARSFRDSFYPDMEDILDEIIQTNAIPRILIETPSNGYITDIGEVILLSASLQQVGKPDLLARYLQSQDFSRGSFLDYFNPYDDGHPPDPERTYRQLADNFFRKARERFYHIGENGLEPQIDLTLGKIDNLTREFLGHLGFTDERLQSAITTKSALALISSRFNFQAPTEDDYDTIYKWLEHKAQQDELLLTTLPLSDPSGETHIASYSVLLPRLESPANL